MKASHFGINPRMFSRNAITVVEKLQRQGYEAYNRLGAVYVIYY